MERERKEKREKGGRDKKRKDGIEKKENDKRVWKKRKKEDNKYLPPLLVIDIDIYLDCLIIAIFPLI